MQTQDTCLVRFDQDLVMILAILECRMSLACLPRSVEKCGTLIIIVHDHASHDKILPKSSQNIRNATMICFTG